MAKNQGGFNLPPGVSFQKQHLSFGWAYVFRHTQLGELGRILLTGRPDGRTLITCEVVGDADDPMTRKRAEIFEPLGREISRQMDIATGGTGEDDQQVAPFLHPPEPVNPVATKLMQCERCDAGVALLIFADDATGPGGLEDYARLMYSKVVEFDLPTWVIGPPIGDRPSPDSPADILKIWPQREPIRQLTPDEFNPLIDRLVMGHCS